MDDALIIEHTRRWIASFVIGLNLCPFARRVFEAGVIRYVVTEAATEDALLVALTHELRTLAATSIANVETTLLIHPLALNDFLDYNDFLDWAERHVAELGLEGIVQIASFHPAYQFADAAPDAVENYTNRSPYPMLHLLREESVTRVADNEAELLAIPPRNIATLRSLGLERIREMPAQVVSGNQTT